MTQASCNTRPEAEAARFVESAIQKLRERGIRITGPRTRVLEALGSTCRPLGAYEVRDILKSEGETADVATVYRVLKVLSAEGLCHFVAEQNGYVGCTHQGSEAHTPLLFVCASCQCVTELPLPNTARAEVAVTAARASFELAASTVEAVGLCSHCR